MTSAPVPLAEQPTTDLQFVERHLRRCENEWKKVYPPQDQDDIDREIASFRRVLATLQQHERAMAALREPRQSIIHAVSSAIDSYWPPFIRRNKGRSGDQWEVVAGIPDEVPISEEAEEVLGVYATRAEAETVAETRSKAETAKAVCAAIMAALDGAANTAGDAG